MKIVIVGAGTAGCALANRLSSNPDWEVTLLEPGPDYMPEALPADLANGTHNSLVRHDWKMRHRVNSQQRVPFPMPRGRVMGGSSAVNTCIALRGQPEDYDEWASLGLSEWSWEKVLPCFRRLERDLDFGHEPWHGQSGPLPLRRYRPDEWTRWQAAFVQTALDAGHPACADSNAPGTLGVGPHAMNKLRGRRISCAEVYLRPWVRARPNLAIHAHTEVRRIVFSGRQVVGVEAWTEQGVRQYPADRVVLTAGAIHTPLVLYRSGVGPQSELDRLGAERVAVNEHVGARLLDHPGSAMFFLPRGWIPRRNDPLIQTVLRMSSGETSVASDIQIQAGSKVPFGDRVIPGCSLMLGLGKPFGTGRIHWPSLARGVRPLIHSGLLDDPRDLAMAVGAMEHIHQLSQSPAMRDLARPLMPLGSRRNRRQDIEAWIRRYSDSGYHPSGTVPMAATARDGAADGHGQVYGVDGLFVGDASLMPTIPSSNTNLPTLMMAERLAELWGSTW